MTVQLIAAAGLLQIHLFGHVIVGADSHFSFRKAGWMEPVADSEPMELLRAAEGKATKRRPAHQSPAKSARASTVAAAPAPAASINELKFLGQEIAAMCDGETGRDCRLFKDGRQFILVTEIMEGSGAGRRLVHHLEPLTREQARAWLDKTISGQFIPQEFRRDFRHHAGTAHAAEARPLGELLSEDQLNGLADLEGEGLSLISQVAGAVTSWLRYAEHLRKDFPGLPETLRAVPGILECEHYEFIHARQRSQFIAKGGAKFFRGLVERARQMPLAEAAEYLSDLADMIEHHPGLADEHRTLMELADAECMLGKSGALEARLD